MIRGGISGWFAVVVSLAACAPAAAGGGAAKGPVDVGRAGIDELDAACEGGQADACEKAGSHYQRGDKAKANLPVAVQRYARGCSLGNHGACRAYAAMLGGGTGVTRDMKGATAVLEKACEAGDAESCFELARTYNMRLQHRMIGELTPEEQALSDAEREKLGDEDRARAKRLLQRACSLGYARACKGIQSHLDEEDPSQMQWLFD